MELKVFYDMADSRDKLTKLLSDDEVTVTRVLLSPRDMDDDKIYVFYETAANKTETEKEKLKSIKTVAKDISDDPMVRDKKLKNATQRRMYMLDKYGLNSTDADMVIDWLAVQATLGTKGEQKNGKE